MDNFCIFHISTSGPRVAVITAETVTSVDKVPGLGLSFVLLVIVVVKISFFELISFYERLNFFTSLGFIATAGHREGLLQPARHHRHQVLLKLVNVRPGKKCCQKIFLVCKNILLAEHRHIGGVEALGQEGDTVDGDVTDGGAEEGGEGGGVFGDADGEVVVGAGADGVGALLEALLAVTELLLTALHLLLLLLASVRVLHLPQSEKYHTVNRM